MRPSPTALFRARSWPKQVPGTGGISPEPALSLAHALIDEPVPTLWPEHALCGPRAVDARALSTKIRLHPRMLGCEHDRDRSRRDHLAVRQHRDAVAHGVQAVEIVRHHEHGQ